MRKIFAMILLSLWLVAPNRLSSQDQSSALEKAKAKFEKSDERLNQAYLDTKSQLPEWKFEVLKRDQKNWIEFRDRTAEQIAIHEGGAEFEGREKESSTYWETLASTTDTRTEIILGWKLDTRFDSTPWTGLWKDGNGGWMGIVIDESGKFCHFHISVVRGATYHLGDISGKGLLNGDMAFFTDKGLGDKSDEDPETWLVFKKMFDSPRIEISGANTQYYHGMRAYFDGVYTRVGELNEVEKTAIIKGLNPFSDDEPSEE